MKQYFLYATYILFSASKTNKNTQQKHYDLIEHYTNINYSVFKIKIQNCATNSGLFTICRLATEVPYE